MSISFDKALGIHQYTVGLRSKRAETIASNIANVNTPGYKAKDLDFSRALQAASSGQQAGMAILLIHNLSKIYLCKMR